MSKVTKEQLDELIKAYAMGKPLISDEEYDDLVEQYVKENGEEYRPFNRQKQSDAVNDIVGTLPKLYGVDTAMREGLPTLNEYIEKHPDYCMTDDKTSNKTFVIQPKFDGCSVAFDCETERFFTRGSKDDGESLDVTVLFRDKIDDIKKSFDDYIDFDDVKVVKFEAIMSDRVYSECLANGSFPKQYKRARDAVSAIITPPFNNKELAKYITLIPLRYYTITGQYEIHPHLKRISRFASIFNKQFDIGSPDQFIQPFKDVIRELRDDILKNGASRSYNNDNYACDGIVISIEKLLHNNVPSQTEFNKIYDYNMPREIDPDTELAIKIINSVKETKLIDIIYQLGNSGKITPVGILEPVKFDNITVDHVTLSTFERVSDMCLRVGDTVRIMYNIIPYFIGTNHDGGVPFALPDVCPICGAKINLTNLKYVTCDNINCRGRIIGKICKYAETMRIFGFGEGKIVKMFELGYLNKVGDIYTFDANKLKNESGFGEASVNDIVNNIKKASIDVPIERWLGAMTDGYAVTSWISILDQLYGREVSCVHDIISMCHDETPNRLIEKIQSGMPYMNFSKMSIDNICTILKTRWNDIQDTVDYIRFATSTKSNNNKGIVCMSGTRDETAKRILEEAGYIVTDKFNSNIVMLVVPYLGFKSSKVAKANKKGIRIIDVEDIYDRRLF